jgi:hypothetical protein
MWHLQSPNVEFVVIYISWVGLPDTVQVFLWLVLVNQVAYYSC